jgi:hypothetical protein
VVLVVTGATSGRHKRCSQTTNQPTNQPGEVRMISLRGCWSGWSAPTNFTSREIVPAVVVARSSVVGVHPLPSGRPKTPRSHSKDARGREHPSQGCYSTPLLCEFRGPRT